MSGGRLEAGTSLGAEHVRGRAVHVLGADADAAAARAATDGLADLGLVALRLGAQLRDALTAQLLLVHFLRCGGDGAGAAAGARAGAGGREAATRRQGPVPGDVDVGLAVLLLQLLRSLDRLLVHTWKTMRKTMSQ